MSTPTATTTSATSTTSTLHHVHRRRDPATAALVFLLAATVLLRPTIAAPVKTDPSSDIDSWWFNACDHHGVQKFSGSNDTCIEDIVHKDSKNQVRRQMKIFMGNFQHDLNSINSTYSQIMKSFDSFTKISLKWLPMFKKPEKPSKTVLVKYHADLQKYVVAVHYLSTIRLKTDIDIEKQMEKRESLLKNLTNNMKSLLCEIETAVNATCQQVPERVAATFVQEESRLNKNLKQFTELLFLDWNVISRFRMFMKHSNKLVRFLPGHKESDNGESEEYSPTMSSEAGEE